MRLLILWINPAVFVPLIIPVLYAFSKFVFSNNAKTILNYTDTIINCDIHTRYKTKEILNHLGYEARNYQENYRRVYLLNNTEISIDSWPLIPTYAEIEGKTNEDVEKVLELVNTKNYKVTTFDVDSIYREIYGIDIMKIKELKFGENNNESMLEHN